MEATAYEQGKVVGIGASSVVYQHSADTVLKRWTDLEGSREDLEIEKVIYEHFQRHTHRYLASYRGSTTDGILLDFYEYGTLRNAIKSSYAKISNRTKGKWILQIADVLKHIHREGIFHSDISTNNILLCRGTSWSRWWEWSYVGQKSTENLLNKTEIRLSDFAGSSFKGSPASVSYESRSSRPGKARIPCVEDEMFAFGTVVFEIYCGKAPFEALSSDEVEAKYAIYEFDQVNDIEPWVGNLIKACWAGNKTTASTTFKTFDQIYSYIRRYVPKTWPERILL
ncbi:kinase-like domain-containing protein [Peziza echinospora]|nr:kinase-like domain-containing protein [Peziza echinospora]